ncbi:hypothetical protein IU449_01880 [Nocardia higoensis]|uniref:Uncharacterized protein n=1 Tax=Nocardia higoensis TaxID=228599 RepID=A0ABS0D480_9NOCA|nr:hypothetical protein [Nocardia higoensis]MBF6353307.1 hypothetical protein [Nocardia higoensis]
MAVLITLLFILLAVTALVVIAAYATVVLTYWFEMRHDPSDPPEAFTAR